MSGCKGGELKLVRKKHCLHTLLCSQTTPAGSRGYESLETRPVGTTRSLWTTVQFLQTICCCSWAQSSRCSRAQAHNAAALVGTLRKSTRCSWGVRARHAHTDWRISEPVEVSGLVMQIQHRHFQPALKVTKELLELLRLFQSKEIDVGTGLLLLWSVRQNLTDALDELMKKLTVSMMSNHLIHLCMFSARTYQCLTRWRWPWPVMW